MTKIDASNYIENNSIYGYVQMTGHKDSFIDGAECADNHPNSLWIKFTDELPPLYELIIIAMKDKNKEDGKWIYYSYAILNTSTAKFIRDYDHSGECDTYEEALAEGINEAVKILKDGKGIE